MRSQLGQICAIGTTIIILYGVCIGILLTPGAWLPLIPSLLAVIFGGAIVLVFKTSREINFTASSLNPLETG